MWVKLIYFPSIKLVWKRIWLQENICINFRTSKKLSLLGRCHDKTDGSYTVNYFSLVCIWFDVNFKLIDINYLLIPFNLNFLVLVCLVSICDSLGSIRHSSWHNFYTFQSHSVALDNNCLWRVHITSGWAYLWHWNKFTDVDATVVRRRTNIVI